MKSFESIYKSVVRKHRKSARTLSAAADDRRVFGLEN
jgi:hypothetical protein